MSLCDRRPKGEQRVLPRRGREYHTGMDRDRSRELSDEGMERRVREAAEDSQNGRLVSCNTAEEVKALMARLRRERV